MNISMSPIGYVRSSRKLPEDDHWDAVDCVIELNQDLYTSESLRGLETFSHVEVVFYMNQVDPEKVKTSARRPRDNPNWPEVGIFAQRGKDRPNQIGVTVCKVMRVDNNKLHVFGLDAIDGTPVLDIKPWVKEFGPRGDVKQPAWITELMKEYWSK